MGRRNGTLEKHGINWRFLASLAALAALSVTASAARADFASCVGSLKSEAARAGVSRQTLDAAFSGIEPDMKVLDFQKAQPEFKTPIWDYMAALVDDERVADGKAAIAQHARGLAYAEQTYGVPRTMLAAIWGVESNFGSDMGARPLVQSLSTLACYGQRAGYFRSELMAALKIIDRGYIPADKLAGSWAGAFGQTQFMPSTTCGSRRRGRTGAATSSIPPTRRSPRPRIISRSRAGVRARPGASR